MTVRVAINGYGRIGRNILRARYESIRYPDLEIVAVNNLGEVSIDAHLTEFDSVHGPFRGEVAHDGTALIVNGQRIVHLAERDPARLPWGDLGIDVVLECTGAFTSKAKASAHLAAGARKVVISAPGGDDVDATVVYGVNDHTLRPHHAVVSNASCTTNCLAPIAHALHAGLGIESGLMTTVHSYTNDQVLTDLYHSDVRRARSATQSMIPTKTGAAAAIGQVLPELAGRLDGLAVRVPTINVSLVDFVFTASRATSVEEVNTMLTEAAARSKDQILQVNTRPLVSIDFNHRAASSIVDLTQTKVSQGRLVKVMAWYDNEWGYANRMLDTAWALATAS
jgi:glyceraldehyde 3-phosphate dehydrogenase